MAVNLRETMTQNPRVGASAAVGLLVLGLGVIFFQRPHHSGPTSHGEVFFSIDDGKTWFADSATNLAPFDKDGKQAVLAHVYRCADGTEFVNYLERYKPDAKQALETQNDPNRKREDLTAIQNAIKAGREVKRPGDANWVAVNDIRQATQVMAIKCPTGGSDAVAVQP